MAMTELANRADPATVGKISYRYKLHQNAQMISAEHAIEARQNLLGLVHETRGGFGILLEVARIAKKQEKIVAIIAEKRNAQNRAR
jgi:hypothetical protein